jgi:hypothetical protein
MICQYATKIDKNINHCSLGLYGGKPSNGTCQNCIKRGENNESFARDLFAAANRSHPAKIQRISGCCDRADQA